MISICGEFFRNPNILGTILNAFLIQRKFGDESGSEVGAEFLSLAVKEEFRSAEFVRQNTTNFAQDLFNAVVKRLSQQGAVSLRCITDLENENLRANIFYRMRGGKKIYSGPIRGKESNVYMFDLKKK